MEKLSFYWTGHEEVEDIQRYTTGGFHPVRLGDVVSSPDSSRKYRILHKLGNGALSTVWLAESLHEPSRCYAAVKIYSANVDPLPELDIFSRLSRGGTEMENVLQLRDSFSLQGPNGTHRVLIHDVLGSASYFVRDYSGGVKHSRRVFRQLTSGLAALHRRGIIHGDLHLGNIGIALPTLNDHSPCALLLWLYAVCTVVLPVEQPPNPEAIPPYLVHAVTLNEYLLKRDSTFKQAPPRLVIMHLRNAIILDEQTQPSCSTAVVCAPELMFQRIARSINPPATKASDVWSLACTIYELFSGSTLFHSASSDDVLLGAMAALCGEVPEEWRSYWNSREELRSMVISHEGADATWQCLLDRLTNGPTPRHTREEVTDMFALLRSMLKVNPECRPSAEEIEASMADPLR